MRLTRHPILEFERGRKIRFEFDGRQLIGFEGESIAAALHANDVRVLRESIKRGRPRGFFCATGRCSSCLMTVDGIPNTMTCVTPLEDGMRVETQRGKGVVNSTELSSAGPRPPEARRSTCGVTTIPLAIVGAGPAGLSAAAYAGRMGVETIVIDENRVPGGQLIKQTHMFFGSREHYARIRGIDIGGELVANLTDLPVKLMLGTTVLGLYPDRTLSLLAGRRHIELKADAVILATGASENMLAFGNCDLPGVYGAGAVQTLMNVHGVVPGKRVLMVGAGNIGLIVAYQLLQAGVEVAAVIDASPEVGGYHVHAAKIRRAGVPILTSHTIQRVTGPGCVESAEICRVDDSWLPVPGTERTLSVDTVCLAVGLTPNCELAFQMGCRETYMAGLGGPVAAHGPDLETSITGIFIAGDASGIEEASTAMIEGQLAGLAAAAMLCREGDADKLARLRSEAADSLRTLRAGPFGAKARVGKEKLFLSVSDGNEAGSE